MNLATPPLRDLAAKLLAEEGDGTERDTPAFKVCERIGGSISKLAGKAGYRSLLARAVTLAQEEVPWLKTTSVAADGTLTGLGDEKVASDERSQGEAVLVAQLLGLLCAFIGEPLTIQLVKQAWPHASIPREDPSKGRTP